jgi:hypothetical protein|tara:strand:- start:8 stop:211 length:204 start_codon:yes stop_codon:yes gene_type:complete
MSIFSILTFTTMAIILLYLKKVEEVFRYQDNPQWYGVWKTMWLAAWMCMFVAILLILFEQPNVRYGL